MEPPATRDYGAVQTEKAKVFEAMRPLKPDDLVRGQYAGYRKEKDVARNSDVETYCAVRLFIDSWRWAGGAILPALGQVPAGDGDRGIGGVEAAAAAVVPGLAAEERPRELHSLPIPHPIRRLHWRRG